jgi:hypothetical protein
MGCDGKNYPYQHFNPFSLPAAEESLIKQHDQRSLTWCNQLIFEQLNHELPVVRSVDGNE